MGGGPVLLARNSAVAESEGGQKFLPPNPLPFCPPERSVSVLPSRQRREQSIKVLFKKGSSFVQQLRHEVSWAKLCYPDKIILKSFKSSTKGFTFSSVISLGLILQCLKI
jgi:hypothetical protein